MALRFAYFIDFLKLLGLKLMFFQKLVDWQAENVFYSFYDFKIDALEEIIEHKV